MSEERSIKPKVEFLAPQVSTLTRDDSWLQREQELLRSIAERAYELFETSGFRDGHDVEDWLRAESELLEPFPLEVRDEGDRIRLRADVSGYSQRDLEIKADDRRVFIAARHSQSSKQKKDRTLYSQQSSRELFREYVAPAEIIPEKVKAEFRDGKLELTLPKRVPGNAALTEEAA
jgi:HSP20 family molecular chaperone IbpA